jgi:AraC-like DNA-binding protein
MKIHTLPSRHGIAALSVSVRDSAVTRTRSERRFAEDGLSLLAICRAAQVRKGSALLLDGRALLSTIGFVCGFTDQAHFARAFRKATGMSPSAFRAAAGMLDR